MPAPRLSAGAAPGQGPGRASVEPVGHHRQRGVEHDRVLLVAHAHHEDVVVEAVELVRGHARQHAHRLAPHRGRIGELGPGVVVHRHAPVLCVEEVARHGSPPPPKKARRERSVRGPVGRPQVQVGRVEPGEGDGRGRVGKADAPALVGNHAARAQRLQHAVGVDRGDAQRVGQLLLRQREREAVVVRQPHRREPRVELAEEVDHLPVGPEPPLDGEPLAQDALVHQGRPPQRARDGRELDQHGLDLLVGDGDDLALGDGGHGVIHGAQDLHMHVAHVARQHEAHDRALPVGQDLVAAGVAGHQDPEMRRILALDHEVGARRHLHGGRDEGVEPLAVGRVERHGVRQPRDHRIVHGSCHLRGGSESGAGRSSPRTTMERGTGPPRRHRQGRARSQRPRDAACGTSASAPGPDRGS